MKRYTLKVTVLDHAITGDHLRSAVESVLLRLHPRITYQFGQVTSRESGSFWVEIASDGDKRLLAAHLKGLESELPVRVEQLGWGWIAGEEAGSAISPGLRNDPLAAIEPKSGPVSYPFHQKSLLFRFFLFLSLTILIIALLVARYFQRQSILLDWSYAALFMVWIFTLNEIPLDIRLYVEQIDCGIKELAVTTWFGKKSVRVDWETIQSLELRGALCILDCVGTKPVRFLVQQGFKDWAELLKTIIQRGCLHAVVAGVGAALYKRYEAP